MTPTAAVIIVAVLAAMAVGITVAWWLAARRDRKRTERFFTENAAIEDQARLDRLQLKQQRRAGQ